MVNIVVLFSALEKKCNFLFWHHFFYRPQLTLEEVHTWGESFERLIKSAQGRVHFRQFLKTEFSEENLMFWLACEDLKKETNKTIVEQTVKQIYEDYISVLSPKEVYGSTWLHTLQ